MQRLFTDANQIASYSVIDDSLLGDVGQLPVDLEYSDARSYDHGQLPRSVETPI